MASDHFKKALELARRQRQAPNITGNHKVVHQLETTTSFRGKFPEDFRNLRYRRTRIQPITETQLRENRVVAAFPDDPSSSPFRILRTQVMQELHDHEWNSVAITAPHSDAGKSLVAANLAVSLSLMTNITVMLVDLDLRKPSVHRYFNLEVENGLYEYLTEGVPLEEILVNPGIDRLVILPGSKPTSGSSELLASKEALHLIDEIRSRYESRIIIFDLPPLIGLDDAMVVLPRIDTALLVIEANKTTEAELRQAMQVLDGHPFMGTVFNKADELDVLQYGY